MKVIAITAASVLMMLGTSAHAQAKSPLYGEVGYTVLKITDDDVDVKPHAVRAIVGYDVHPNLAVEGMAAVGVKKDSLSFEAVNFDVKLQHAYGVFAKPKFNVTNDVEVFGRLGWVKSKVKATGSLAGITASASESDDDFAFGAGVNYRLNQSTHIGFDYIRYMDKDGAKVDGWTIGVGFRF